MERDAAEDLIDGAGTTHFHILMHANDLEPRTPTPQLDLRHDLEVADGLNLDLGWVPDPDPDLNLGLDQDQDRSSDRDGVGVDRSRRDLDQDVDLDPDRPTATATTSVSRRTRHGSPRLPRSPSHASGTTTPTLEWGYPRWDDTSDTTSWRSFLTQMQTKIWPRLPVQGGPRSLAGLCEMVLARRVQRMGSRAAFMTLHAAERLQRSSLTRFCQAVLLLNFDQAMDTWMGVERTDTGGAMFTPTAAAAPSPHPISTLTSTPTSTLTSTSKACSPFSSSGPAVTDRAASGGMDVASTTVAASIWENDVDLFLGLEEAAAVVTPAAPNGPWVTVRRGKAEIYLPTTVTVDTTTTTTTTAKTRDIVPAWAMVSESDAVREQDLRHVARVRPSKQKAQHGRDPKLRDEHILPRRVSASTSTSTSAAATAAAAVSVASRVAPRSLLSDMLVSEIDHSQDGAASASTTPRSSWARASIATAMAPARTGAAPVLTAAADEAAFPPLARSAERSPTPTLDTLPSSFLRSAVRYQQSLEAQRRAPHCDGDGEGEGKHVGDGRDRDRDRDLVRGDNGSEKTVTRSRPKGPRGSIPTSSTMHLDEFLTRPSDRDQQDKDKPAPSRWVRLDSFQRNASSISLTSDVILATSTTVSPSLASISPPPSP